MSLLGIAHGIHQLVVGVGLALLAKHLHHLLIPRLEGGGELALLGARLGGSLTVLTRDILAGCVLGHF